MSAPARPSPTTAPALVLPAWVGDVDLDDPDAPARPARAPEPDEAPFRSARVLLTRGGRPVALVDVPVRGGSPDRDALTGLAPAPAGPTPPAPTAAGLPATTVVVCTRNRPTHLAVLLSHLTAAPDGRDTPDGSDDTVTLLVVDNAPDDEATRVLVEGHPDPRVRYVREPRPGLSRARNRGLAGAADLGSEVVVFVDDDVTMRPGWLTAVRTAFTGPGRVSCVTGPVLPGTLVSAVQLTGDGALGWTAGFAPRRFTMDGGPDAGPRRGSPLFPFAPGEYGVGADFAVRVDDALAIGGFDELLGAGAPTKGGEDIEFWVRLVTSGRTLVYEPAAWVWHHHRDSPEALSAQLTGYALGLGGYLGAVLCSPRMCRLALGRLPRAAGHLVRLRRREAAVGLGRTESGVSPGGIARGAGIYLRARARTGLARRRHRRG